MSNSNRCPKCGGTANHLVTDINGNRYYRCMTGLTSFRKSEGVVSRDSYFKPCDTIIDQNGKVFSGIIAFATGNKVETLVVNAGKGGN